MRNRVLAALAVAACLTTGGAATARQASHGFVPKKTAWGDPDFRAVWTTDHIFEAGIPVERPPEQGKRRWLTAKEFAKRLEEAKKTDADKSEIGEYIVPNGTIGLVRWLRGSRFGRSTSLIVDPADGRLPPMTPSGEALRKAGRTSWNKDQPIDWVADLDTYDRCIARGFPTAMMPADRDNANAIRVFQSPGIVAFQLETLGYRIVPVGAGPGWPNPVRGWLGRSRGHWEGNTLVIETTNLVAGDSASGDASKHAGTPAPGAKRTTIPVGEHARTVERLTMTATGKLTYEVRYWDPDVFTAPWTAQLEWTRDDSYRMYEFACHEGNVQVRTMINASRAQRAKDAAKVAAR